MPRSTRGMLVTSSAQNPGKVRFYCLTKTKLCSAPKLGYLSKLRAMPWLIDLFSSSENSFSEPENYSRILLESSKWHWEVVLKLLWPISCMCYFFSCVSDWVSFQSSRGLCIICFDAIKNNLFFRDQSFSSLIVFWNYWRSRVLLIVSLLNF